MGAEGLWRSWHWMASSNWDCSAELLKKDVLRSGHSVPKCVVLLFYYFEYGLKGKVFMNLDDAGVSRVS